MKTKLTVKLISVLVALSMVICCMSFAFADVSAETVNDKATGSAIAGSVVENDGFTWDNATVYFMLTDRFKTATHQTTTHTAEHSTKTVSRFPAGTLLRAHSTAVTLQVLHRLSRRAISATSA